MSGKVILPLLLLLIVGVLSPECLAQRKPAPVLAGKLLKSNGRPLAYTEIELVEVGSDKISDNIDLTAISLGDGSFSFTKVPNGKYTLSINFDNFPTELSPYEPFFYPASAERAQAQVFELDGSTVHKGIVFKLPPAMVYRTIAARAKWPEGRPVLKAFVGLVDLDFGKSIWFQTGKIGPDGVFKLSAFEGRRYQFGAFVPDRFPESMDDPPVNIVAAGESEIFRLDAKTPLIEFTIRSASESEKLMNKYVASIFLNRPAAIELVKVDSEAF